MYSMQAKEFAVQQEELIRVLECRIVPSADNRGREECMRDYARVLYSSSFRRLQGKMQLLGVDAHKFNRNRLTHSLEVAQIARSIAFDLGLQKTVVSETCSLAHDIGNPPFGHYGEVVLNELSAEFGGYEGNAQAFRILRTLEKKHHSYDGLNLTLRTMFGVTKYFSKRSDDPKKFLYDADFDFLTCELRQRGVTLRKGIDAQIMDLADEIAYAAHDLEDALSFRVVTIGEMLHEFKISGRFGSAYEAFAEIVRDVQVEALKCNRHDTSEEYSVVLRKELTSRIVNTLCRDIDVVENGGVHELGYKTNAILAEGLKKLLFKAVLRKKDVQLYERRGEKVIRGLFEVLSDAKYNKDNILLPPELRGRDDGEGRVVVDYIAGMMDSFAAQEYERFFGKGSSEAIYFS